MTKTDIIKQQCRSLKLAALSANLDTIVLKAEKEHFSYLDLINALMDSELQHRQEKDRERRTKHARLPLSYNLDLYDKSFQNGLDIKRLKQLRELIWLEQGYNLIFMGPSGTSKTYLAAGLCFDAIEKGYRAYFETMEDLVKVLKMKDIGSTTHFWTTDWLN
jgi:DNA replication protein DnaC